MVTLPAIEGQIGVYPQHVRLITQIVPGEVIVHQGRPGDDSSPSAKGWSRSPPTASRSSPTWRFRPTGIDEAKAEEARARAAARLQREDLRRGGRVRQRLAGAVAGAAAGQTAAPQCSVTARRRASRWPSLGWLPGYRARSGCEPDVVAGLTLAAYLLPAGIGDASLAGLPPEAGLYACLFSGLVFWLFCSSKHTVITVTSALSLLIGASVGELSAGDPARHAALRGVRGAHDGGDRVRGVAGPRRQRRSASSPRPSSSGSRRAWRSTWRARSCPSCSASRARTAISGSARPTSSRIWATRIRVAARRRGRPGRARRRQSCG